MKTFYIFRHGDTFATQTKTDYGDQVLTAPIIPEAKVYLQRIGKYLSDIKNCYCVSSEILRCRQTAEIVGKEMKANFHVDKRLNEFYLESLDDFINRIESFVTDMDLHAQDNIVICTHGAGIGSIKHLLLQNELTEENLIDYPAPGVLTVIKSGVAQEIDFR
jgi:broad specificity phosphatase PhoE